MNLLGVKRLKGLQAIRGTVMKFPSRHDESLPKKINLSIEQVILYTTDCRGVN
jgi:hypothetical protein